MGMVFGKICVETPKFELIRSTEDYEIRKYSPSVIAEITYDPAQFNGDKDGGFKILANYIGVLGNPQNTTPEKIAMTAPVITRSAPEKIPMTRRWFGGGASADVVAGKVAALRRSLERDGYKVVGEFLLGRYNPPWSLPAFRTNEVMLPIE
ncbi:SOUL heme-binding family protein [Actinidia rufa]|uniref:SOUL heme-binding family protein n=1 Tax=Actinidia rufa TaxID=165716 RepID=A0A7J0E708_9ERIC|nr:SOUL heme-binding family protein [Actinidia rufa]